MVYSLGFYCFGWKFLTDTYFINICLLTWVQSWIFSSLDSKANLKSDFFFLVRTHLEMLWLPSLEWGFAPLLHEKILFKAVIFTLNNMSGATCNVLEDFKIKKDFFPLNISVVIRVLINCWVHKWLQSLANLKLLNFTF